MAETLSIQLRGFCSANAHENLLVGLQCTRNLKICSSVFSVAPNSTYEGYINRDRLKFLRQCIFPISAHAIKSELVNEADRVGYSVKINGFSCTSTVPFCRRSSCCVSWKNLLSTLSAFHFHLATANKQTNSDGVNHVQ